MQHMFQSAARQARCLRMGQSRHFGRWSTTSGPPPEADIVTASRHVSKVPWTDIGRLFDHLVGAGEEGGWDCQTDFLSGLQIDDQFEASRLLDGQLGRFPSFEDF